MQEKFQFRGEKTRKKVSKMKGPKKIWIFDTTLRDGEQSPGINLSSGEKLWIAQLLEMTGVDVIEAGFPANSKYEKEAVQIVARNIKKSIVCALARAQVPKSKNLFGDIDVAWESIKQARNPMIHVFTPTSGVHMEHMTHKSPRQVLDEVAAGVNHAKGYCTEVEFSPMDATRTKFAFLCEVVRIAIAAGATRINIPDTVGREGINPFSFRDFIARLVTEIPVLGDQVVLSVHCHNDRGLATANAFGAILAGANQVECTVNGIGERAGNTATEEIVTLINDHSKIYNISTSVDELMLFSAAKVVERHTGYEIAPNKSIVGENAFTHEAGIHVKGLIDDPKTFQDLDPKRFGRDLTIVLGKHSGAAAIKYILEQQGIYLEPDEFKKFLSEFQKMIIKQKVELGDLMEVLDKCSQSGIAVYHLEQFAIEFCKPRRYKGRVWIKHAAAPKTFRGTALGSGPVDAICKAIDKALPFIFIDDAVFKIKPLKNRNSFIGSGAEGSVSVYMLIGGKEIKGQAISTDLIEASARAYIDAINRYLFFKTS